MSFEEFVTQGLTGLSRAGLLFIVSVGLSLVFGAMRVVNLAHGSLYMVGAFVTSSVVLTVGGDFGLWPSLLAGAAAAAAIGLVIEVGVLRRLYGREPLLQLLATFAVLLIISDLVQLVWGGHDRTVARPAGLDGSIEVVGSPFPVYNLFIVVFALAVAAGVWLLMNRTGLGRDIRAAVVDPEMVGGVGISVPRLFTTLFVLGAALAGLGGAIVAPASAVGTGMDIDILVEAFAVTIIGGLGSIAGTLVGALLVGMASSYGILLAPDLALAVIFIVMVAVLAIRPAGLFGIPERT
ncbi:MAG: branched-chain amino acid ABC transporter permease [Solirubrobacterales bacterium]